MVTLFRVRTDQDYSHLTAKEQEVVHQTLGLYGAHNPDDLPLYGPKINYPMVQHSPMWVHIPGMKPDSSLDVYFDIEANRDRIRNTLYYEHRNDPLEARLILPFTFPGHDPILLYGRNEQGQYTLSANGRTDEFNDQLAAYLARKKAENPIRKIREYMRSTPTLDQPSVSTH